MQSSAKGEGGYEDSSDNTNAVNNNGGDNYVAIDNKSANNNRMFDHS